MSVAGIKEAVNKLPAQERLKLLAELCDWPDDDWDRQMKRDAAAGKFAGLNEEASEAFKSGKVKSQSGAISLAIMMSSLEVPAATIGQTIASR